MVSIFGSRQISTINKESCSKKQTTNIVYPVNSYVSLNYLDQSKKKKTKKIFTILGTPAFFTVAGSAVLLAGDSEEFTFDKTEGVVVVVVVVVVDVTEVVFVLIAAGLNTVFVK